MNYHDIETLFDEMIDDINYVKITSKLNSLELKKKKMKTKKKIISRFKNAKYI